ncbi:hypothetical protein [Nocardiopsis sp. LOL_012]|uniref:hypothetical protein n=1 Tax=Nocardiopsis sp. LOL_012 TaxID=3345409 RepID=UPI003A86A0E3
MSFTSRTTACAALCAALTLTACAPVGPLLETLVPDAGAPASTTDPDPVPLADYDLVDRDDPFGGTEAEDYAEDFGVPEAQAVGPYSEQRVREAYLITEDFLEAVYLDQDSVFGQDDSAFTSLLGERYLDWYEENLGHEDPAQDSAGVLFHLTPGTAEPIGDVVKVNGRMWAEQAQDPYGTDYLAVRTEYTVVHPVARPGELVSVRLVTSHYGEVGFYDLGGTWDPWPGWWSASGPAHCLEEATVTPAYPDEWPRGDKPQGPARDPYALEELDPEDEECGTIQET